MDYLFPLSITIDAAGRFVIPKVIRDEFNLVPGSPFEISVEKGGVLFKVADLELRLKERQGLLVHHGTGTVDLDVAEFIRTERGKAAEGTKR